MPPPGGIFASLQDMVPGVLMRKCCHNILSVHYWGRFLSVTNDYCSAGEKTPHSRFGEAHGWTVTAFSYCMVCLVTFMLIQLIPVELSQA